MGLLALAAPCAAAPGSPLFHEVTPPWELITLPARPEGYLSFRAERRELTLWGQELAVLLYSGPLATEQRELNNGRYSLITVPRNPAEEILFLEREVWPALGSPFLSTGGLRDLAPDAVLAPDDPRLPRLEQNLLRAAWRPLAQELGLTGDARAPAGALSQHAAFRRLQERVIGAGERNGVLHESQHALDEAHKVYPDRYRRPFASPAEAETRALLAALAHSQDPHYVLYQAVRQYRQRLAPYEAAVEQVLRALAGAILQRPREAPAVRVQRNIMLQLPRLPAETLRQRAAQAMEALFARSDGEAGYALDYHAYRSAAAGLNVGTLRGEIRPEDVPPAEEGSGQPAIFWGFQADRVASAGVHVYLADTGVQVARHGEYGLAVSGAGYVAAHLRVPPGPGPWRLEITGGAFAPGATRGESLPLILLGGTPGRSLPVQSLPGGGLFVAEVPAALAAEGMVRLVLAPLGSGSPPAFLTGLRLLPASGPVGRLRPTPTPDPSGETGTAGGGV